MKRLLIVPALLLLATCATDDYNEPAPMPQRAPRAERTSNATPGGLEIMLPNDWWRDEMIANAVNLRSEQVSALEKISTEQGQPITQLQHDSAAAIKDVRAALDADPVKSEDIIAAGDKLRNLRDTLFDRQVRMIAAERALLSTDQWHRLQDAMQQQRRDRMQQNPYGGGRGGRGGYGGRRPGWPGF